MKNVKSSSNREKNKLFRKKEKFNLDSLKEDKKEFLKNKLMLRTQQRFKSKRHNVFTEEINKITLHSNDDKECNQWI